MEGRGGGRVLDSKYLNEGVKKGFTDGGGKSIKHKNFFGGGICSFHELGTSHSKGIETLFGCFLVILCRRYSPDSSDAGVESCQ